MPKSPDKPTLWVGVCNVAKGLALSPWILADALRNRRDARAITEGRSPFRD